jgi:hypothetical protein
MAFAKALPPMTRASPAPNDCPEPPGFRASLPTLILHEACQTAGGIAPLAQLLEVPTPLVQRWLEGDETAPESIYQACIDIVLLFDPAEEWDRAAKKTM